MQQVKLLSKISKSNSQIVNNNYPDGVTNENVPSFLLKTYEILQNTEYSNIISWTKNGEGFIVKNVKEFSMKILPIYFRHNNYTSFVRQLNMYDFHKTRQENQENAFKNFLFKKGQKHLLKQIQRKDYKKNKQSNKEFYSILQKPKNYQNCSIKEIQLQSSAIITTKSNFLLQSSNLAKYKQQSNSQQAHQSTPTQNELPLNETFKENINELAKIKDDLQQKSLQLMCFKEKQFNNEMILRSIDVLFACGTVNQRMFYQMEQLRLDFELEQRKQYFGGLREQNLQDNNKGKNNRNDILTTESLGENCQTNKKSMNPVATVQSKSSFAGFQKYQVPRVSLFSLLNNE